MGRCVWIKGKSCGPSGSMFGNLALGACLERMSVLLDTEVCLPAPHSTDSGFAWLPKAYALARSEITYGLQISYGYSAGVKGCAQVGKEA